MTENKDAAVRPPVAEIREVFVECETAMAKFGETKKQADHRAWKRKGSVLEVVCVGHMRKCLDYIEYLETIAPPPAQDAIREALEGFTDDYITSESHHPGYVLIPTAKFERICTALSAPNVAGERPKPYTKLHHVLHAAGLYPTPQPESVNDVRAALAETIDALKQCHAQFDFYAFEHRQAEKFEKAETNQRFADMIAQVVAKHGVGR